VIPAAAAPLPFYRLLLPSLRFMGVGANREIKHSRCPLANDGGCYFTTRLSFFWRVRTQAISAFLLGRSAAACLSPADIYPMHSSYWQLLGDRLRLLGLLPRPSLCSKFLVGGRDCARSLSVGCELLW